MIKVATVCTGIGSPEQAIRELEVEHEIVFGCENDKYAMQTYLANFNPGRMCDDMTTEDWSNPDLYADLFVGGIPCQAFSIAGKRLGELDPRGLLFYNFYDYVKKRQPKAFIIENVKGLLSDNGGKTFQTWLDLLSGSVNNQYNMFPHEDSLEYNVHWTVLNSKDFGVPQNRERVFIVGIRKDLPNTFEFPQGFPLTIRLKDILEPVVDEKYYLSDKMIAALVNCNEGFEGRFNPNEGNGISSALTARYHKMAPTDTFIKDQVIIEGEVTPNSQAGKVYSYNGIFPTLTAGTHGYALGYIKEPILILGAKTGLYTVESTGLNENQVKKMNELSVDPDVAGCLTEAIGRGGSSDEYVSMLKRNAMITNRIRRLTPLECFRLQGYPDDFFYRSKYATEAQFAELLKKYPKLKGKRCTWNNEQVSDIMSDTQLYKQAGNSITTKKIKAIIKNLLPILNHE